MQKLCKECSNSYDEQIRKHLCPHRNKVIINCGYCDVNLIDFIMYPGYEYPRLPKSLFGNFVCFDCEQKAAKSLYETRS